MRKRKSFEWKAVREKVAEVVATVVAAVTLLMAVDVFAVALMTLAQNHEAYFALVQGSFSASWRQIGVCISVFCTVLVLGGEVLLRLGCMSFNTEGVRKHVTWIITTIICIALTALGLAVAQCWREICQIAVENLISNCIAAGCMDLALVVVLIVFWHGKKQDNDT